MLKLGMVYCILAFCFVGQIKGQTDVTLEGTDFFDDLFDVECFPLEDNCTLITELSDTVCEATILDNTIYRCACNTAAGFKRDGASCRHQTQMGDVCEDDVSVCVTNNSHCGYYGGLSGTKTCMCNQGYIRVDPDDEPSSRMCALELSATDDDCLPCFNNHGRCYTLPNGTAACLCPESQSGAACETKHLVVKCDLARFEMDVCWTPPPDQADIEFEMFPENYGTSVACQAKQVEVDVDGECTIGSYRLMLPMDDTSRELCGTEKVPSGADTERYESRLLVKPADTNGGEIYKAFCGFTILADKTGPGQILRGKNGNDQGEELEPDITFSALSILMRPTGTQVRRGDRLYYRIDLELDGTYAAVTIEQCTMSSVGTIPAKNAEYQVLMVHGCPVDSEENIFTYDNMFDRERGKPNVLQTKQPIPVVQMKGSNKLFMHCRVKLCLFGNEADCETKNRTECGMSEGVDQGGDEEGDEGGDEGGRRKKRAAEMSEVDLDLELEIVDAEAQQAPSITMTTTGFAIVITLLVAIVLLSIGVATLLYVKLRGKNNKVQDNLEMTQKPQRFSLPRISRTHMRM